MICPNCDEEMEEVDEDVWCCQECGYEDDRS